MQGTKLGIIQKLKFELNHEGFYVPLILFCILSEITFLHKRVVLLDFGELTVLAVINYVILLKLILISLL